MYYYKITFKINFKVYAVEDTEIRGKLPPLERGSPQRNQRKNNRVSSNPRIITKDELDAFTLKNIENEKKKEKDCIIF